MSLKTKNIIKIIIKVSILSSIILAVVYFSSGLLGGQETVKSSNTKKTISSNIDNFTSTKIKPIANVGVAISTNLGIKYTKNQTISTSNIYKEIFSVEEILIGSKEVKEEIVGKNINYLKEYLNFVRTDFNTLLKNSTDKKRTVENIINQLEIRYTRAVTNSNFLIEQNNIINGEYLSVVNSIETVKQNIASNYGTVNIEGIYENMENYYTLKQQEAKLKIYLVLINNFLLSYEGVNNFTALLLDTLINNKDAISKNTYVVIPDSGDALIDDFGLIISEAEYKANTNK
ncbi:MAG: hypothetical protein PHH06_04865 [Candidatus Gracilibacteria bacterium]|nr:hypothetical protein [Candidatus Gracilibacteria bacterium]